ncbi:sodium-independent sulfate anion transporter-like isoform X2 [Physella acuta]|uniref:sodium-independent sulfate anion transporter-like isoform X2 n=1 Tax=Physella acuta TaxID=109671 RepID=UPI0027DB7ABD|nr:sodium-independent sulfate anion transporter-like isoform X2 [Physella acuta]
MVTLFVYFRHRLNFDEMFTYKTKSIANGYTEIVDGTDSYLASSEFELDIGNRDAIKKQVKTFCRKTFTLQNFLAKFPIIKWLPKYRCDTFQADFIAGITVGLTVIPQGLAYAQVADLPAQYGLYSAFVGCFVYCLLGTSKDITLGPTAILSLLTATFGTAVSPVLPNGEKDPTMTIVLTFLTGVIQLVMGILKLGILVNFISYPVINAFTSAAAITIAIGQIKSLLGLKNIPNDFIPMVHETCRKLPETKIWDMTMGLSSLVLVILLKKLREIKWKDADTSHPVPLSKRILRKTLWLIGTSANVIVVVSAAGVVAILETYNIKNVISVTGKIKAGMPPFEPPKFEINKGNITMSSGELFSHLGAGLGIVPLLAIVETMAIGKAFARANNYKLDPTQELIAVGASNILSSFCSSYPITGSFSRTAVNSQSGVKTPMGGIWTGGLVILALCVLTPWFYYIPKSALAAVIIAAVLQMVEFHVVIQLWRANKLDLFPFFITFICSLIVGIEYGILIGVGVSVLMLLYPTARPKVKYLATKGFLMVTPLHGLNFPAAEYLEIQALDRALTEDKIRYIVLDMEHLSSMDFTAVQSVKALMLDCNKHEIKLVLANGRPHVNRQLKNADIKNLIVMKTVKDVIDKFSTREEGSPAVIAEEIHHVVQDQPVVSLDIPFISRL